MIVWAVVMLVLVAILIQDQTVHFIYVTVNKLIYAVMGKKKNGRRTSMRMYHGRLNKDASVYRGRLHKK